YYVKSLVSVNKFYPLATNKTFISTFGVKGTFVTSAKTDKKVVYTITKAIFENLKDLKQLHPALKYLDAMSMLQGLSAPLHPGALKYYKEAGLE
ncbi:MAG: C4-dicarboxylate ABC transporter substrate-binding protein, partial [archaeon]|nr:C4-dicarboxylate ABC transporter substrate-binding protein [archaeon]